MQEQHGPQVLSSHITGYNHAIVGEPSETLIDDTHTDWRHNTGTVHTYYYLIGNPTMIMKCS